MSRATATTFVADAFGKTYTFNCDETITAKGLTHVCSDGDGHVTQKVWGNRPWEGFKYEAVLHKAINKLPEAVRPVLIQALIEAKKQTAQQEADTMLEDFQRLYDGLTPENKERMKRYPMLHTEADARICMGFMGLLTLMQQ